MKTSEAIRIVIDVAIKRAPHNRIELNNAVRLLESPTANAPGKKAKPEKKAKANQ